MSDIPTEKLYCYKHPNIETSLRCNRCERPICPQCAILTPTGYRCKECVRDQQKVFDTAQVYDCPLAFILAAGIAFAGSLLASRFGFFTIFIGPLAGLIIAEVVRFAVHRRRSRLLYQITSLATLLGSLPIVLIAIFASILNGTGFALFSLLWPAVYSFLVTTSVYYRLSGIQIRI
jgi:hypothetical protein